MSSSPQQALSTNDYNPSPEQPKLYKVSFAWEIQTFT